MPAESPLRDGNAAQFELIETLRWEPDTGFLRIDRHLARLYASAHALGFRADPDAIGAALHDAVGDRVPLRVRLTLARDGAAKCITQPFEPLPPDTVWKLRIASRRLDSSDPLLRHKTTRREAYEAARAEFPADLANEVLLFNEQGEICEGTITNVFADIGGDALVTPPVSSGLLPGVLRAELLDAGKAREGLLTEATIGRARALYVGNSLRGLIRAKLAD